MSSKLRDALEQIHELLSIGGKPDTAMCIRYEAANQIAKEALAEQTYEAEWKSGAECEYAYCSHCGHQQWAGWDTYREAEEKIREFYKEYKFCPNCGFEMKGANNE